MALYTFMGFTLSLFPSFHITWSALFLCFITHSIESSIFCTPFFYFQNVLSISFSLSTRDPLTRSLSFFLSLKRRSLGHKPQVNALLYICVPLLSHSLSIVDVLGIGRAIKLRLFYWSMKKQACSGAVHLG